MNLHDELEGGSLRDLEEALADLAAQNEQLEVDCRELEEHCRDLERQGYPSPCPVDEVLQQLPTPPESEREEVDADSRVQELLKAREKSFAAMAEMQVRCSNQQSEMERLLEERSKLREELQESKQQLQELQAQVDRDELESMSQATGDDGSESPQGGSRKPRKKRHAQNFRQAHWEGVEGAEEVLLRSLVSKAQASSLWYDVIVYLLEKAGEDGLPKTTSEGEVESRLKVMAYQIEQRLEQLGKKDAAGVLESMLKTVGKVTDQALDSAVLYVDSAVDRVSSPSSRSESSRLEDSKTTARERFQRRQRSRMSLSSSRD